MKKLFALILILIACVGVLRSTDYYIKNGGNDGNTGLSDAQAWATLSKIASAFSGDQSDTNIYLKRGSVFREMITFQTSTGGTSGHPWTIGAYDTGDDPKIMGSEQISTWTDQGGNIWRASCSDNPGSYDDGPVFFVDTNGDGKIHWGIEDATPDAEYDWYWSSNYLYCYSSADPDTRYGSVEATTSARINGIQSNYNCNWIYIRDLEICYTSEQGIHGNTDEHYWTIDNCHVHHNGVYSGAHTDLADNIMWEGSGWTIKNNILHDAYAHNIQHYGGANDSDGDIIEHNICYNGCHAQVDVKVYSGEHTSSNQIIRYNLIYTDSDFPWPEDTSAASISVLAYSGYGLMNDTQIYGNIILNFQQWGIYLDAGADGVTIYNNVIWGRNTIVTGTDAFPGCIMLAGYNGLIPRDVVIKNNIIGGNLKAAGAGISIWDDSEQGSITCDYNCFYITTGHFAHTCEAGYPEDIFYEAGDWADWKTDYGWDTHSVWNDNPDFANAGGTSAIDYEITSGSPCRDTGVNVSLTEDYFGNSIPYNTIPDIGAHEFSDSPTAHVIKLAPGTVIRLRAGTTVRIKN